MGKFNSAFLMKSPLRGNYYDPQGEEYVSTVGMIQAAANSVSSNSAKIDSKNKKAGIDKDFNDKAVKLAAAGFGVDSAEYKQLYVDTYGPIKPKET